VIDGGGNPALLSCSLRLCRRVELGFELALWGSMLCRRDNPSRWIFGLSLLLCTGFTKPTRSGQQ